MQKTSTPWSDSLSQTSLNISPKLLDQTHNCTRIHNKLTWNFNKFHLLFPSRVECENIVKLYIPSFTLLTSRFSLQVSPWSEFYPPLRRWWNFMQLLHHLLRLIHLFFMLKPNTNAANSSYIPTTHSNVISFPFMPAMSRCLISPRLRESQRAVWGVYLSTHKKKKKFTRKKLNERGGKILVYPNFNNTYRSGAGKKQQNSFNKRRTETHCKRRCCV